MALFGRESDRERQRAEAWADWFRRQNPYAIASLVLGIFSIIEFGVLLIFGIAGALAGIVALIQLRQSNGQAAPAMPEPADSHRDTAGAVDAPHHAPPLILATDDEPDERRPHWTEGRRLAWAGIITSVLSLVLAALLYLRVV
jgi:hypothetical protein